MKQLIKKGRYDRRLNLGHDEEDYEEDDEEVKDEYVDIPLNTTQSNNQAMT